MKPAYLTTCLLVLFMQQATAQLINKGILFVGPNTTLTTHETLINDKSLINQGTLHLRGDALNNAFITSPDGDWILDGSAAQTLMGASITVRNLTFDNSASSPAIRIQTPLTVTGTAFFNRGIVRTDATRRLILAPNAQAANVSALSHVVGPVQKFGAEAFTFPVGNGTAYRPARLEPRNGQPTDAFTVEYVEAAPSAGSLASCLRAISDRGYWQINRDRGNVPIRIGLAYAASATTDPASLRVVHLRGDHWEPLTCEANGGLVDGLVFSNSTLPIAGAFTLGSAVDPLSAQPIPFSAQLSDKLTHCAWRTGPEGGASHFIVERSPDLREWTEISRVTAQGNYSTYELTDTHPLAGTSYYRLKQVDNKGVGETSKPVTVVNDDAAPAIQILANPTDGQHIWVYTRNLANPAFQLIHLNGQSAPLQINQQGVYYQLVPRQSLSAGLYLLQVTDGSFRSTERLLVH